MVKIAMICSAVLASIGEALFLYSYFARAIPMAKWVSLFWPFVYFHVLVFGFVALYSMRGNVIKESLGSYVPEGAQKTVEAIGVAHTKGTRIMASLIMWAAGILSVFLGIVLAVLKEVS